MMEKIKITYPFKFKTMKNEPTKEEMAMAILILAEIAKLKTNQTKTDFTIKNRLDEIFNVLSPKTDK